jgi:DNA-binding NtrC family response regulator
MNLHRHKRPSILLVDDEPSIRFTVKSLLEEQDGYRVDTAANTAEACRLLRKRHYAAVITDLNLDQTGSGVDVIRAAKGLSSPPLVVLYTGFPTLAAIREAFRARVDYVVFKPIDISELRSSLFRLIRHRGGMAA